MIFLAILALVKQVIAFLCMFLRHAYIILQERKLTINNKRRDLIQKFSMGTLAAAFVPYPLLAGAQPAVPARQNPPASDKGGRKIILGQSVPLSGPADQIGLAYMNGAKLYFDAYNSKNGASGNRIDLRVLDDGYSATKAAANAKQLIDAGAEALFGFVGTASCDAASMVAKSAQLTFFAPFAASDKLHEASETHVFHIRPALADEAYKIARHCATLNQDRIGVFAEDDAMGRGGLAAVVQALVDLKRPPIVGSALSPVNSNKVEPAVAQLIKLMPQAIILVSLSTSAAALIQQMRKAGYGGQFLNFSVVGIDTLYSALGKNIGGIVMSQVVPSFRSTGIPIIREYLEVLNQSEQTPTYESVEGFIAARTFAEGFRRSTAIPATGKTDRASLQKAFETLGDIDVGGFRVNLRPKRYESVRAIDLVTVTPEGKVVR